MKTFKLITNEKIQEQVAKLALDILTYCKEAQIEKLNIIWIAEGAMFFVADLSHQLESLDCVITSIKASSYGTNKISSGEVEIIGTLPALEGKDVLLIDDILETGNTLSAIKSKILAQKVRSCKTCVLLDKNKQNAIAHADFKCFDIENKFVFGYGLDLDKAKRHLKDIFYKA